MGKNSLSMTQQQLDALVAKGGIKGYQVTVGKGAGQQVQSAAADPEKKPVNKYGNKKVFYDGMWFDSTLERDRWIVLCILQERGIIAQLQRQVDYVMQVEEDKICSYIADFVYLLVGYNGKPKLVVEDTKSAPTAKKADFRLKKKLMKAIHKIEIKIIFSPV